MFSAGTLGAIVVDSVDGKMVGLSNNHVYTANPFIASDRTGTVGENVYQNFVSQPADLDGGILESDEIGKVKRYYPLSLNSSNYVDAALTTLNSIGSNSYLILGLINNSFLDFATTQEIDDLINSGTAIFKAGRTTGPIGSPLTTNLANFCEVSITQINVSATVGGYVNNESINTVDFEDCLIFSYNENQPGVSIPGDSGSVLIARIGGVLKLVGLCFADGPISNPINLATDGTLGIANRIDRVAELLEIEPWTSNKEIKINKEDPSCYVVMPGLSSEKFIYLNGKKYYQIGTTNEKPNLNCFPTPTPNNSCNTLYSWGGNYNGELGTGQGDPVYSTTPINFVSGDWEFIFTYGGACFAIDKDEYL
jgi:hypothetical protein